VPRGGADIAAAWVSQPARNIVPRTTDVKRGTPDDLLSPCDVPAAEAERPVAAFNQERMVARAWPASENRIAVSGLTY